MLSPARPLRIVAVSGGLQRPSKAATLAEHLMGLIGEDIHSEQHLVELGELAPQLAGALWRSQLPDTVERQLTTVEQADVLVVSTPVYRGSYTGLFKHFFDFVHQDALVDTPILLAATGGSEPPPIARANARNSTAKGNPNTNRTCVAPSVPILAVRLACAPLRNTCAVAAATVIGIQRKGVGMLDKAVVTTVR